MQLTIIRFWAVGHHTNNVSEADFSTATLFVMGKDIIQNFDVWCSLRKFSPEKKVSKKKQVHTTYLQALAEHLAEDFLQISSCWSPE